MTYEENQKIFKEKKFLVIRNAISKELRDFVTQYALFDEMQNFNGIGDGQTPRAYYRYGDPAMETLLIQFHKMIEENTGLSLHPTYSYYRVYRQKDDLEYHVDRVSCEISATLCINHSYEDDYSWPIYIDSIPVNLNPGDIAIYKGCELYHWRNSFDHKDENVWQVQGFFHYVDANGPYAEWKYDKRSSLGLKKVQPKSYIINV